MIVVRSAGVISVVQQMTAYGGRDDGLFRATIVDSGVFAYMNNSLDSQTPTWNACMVWSFAFVSVLIIPVVLLFSLSSSKPHRLCGHRRIGMPSCPSILDFLCGALLNSRFTPTPIPDGDFMLQQNMVAINAGKVIKAPHYWMHARRSNMRLYKLYHMVYLQCSDAAGVGSLFAIPNTTAFRAAVAGSINFYASFLPS